MWFYYSNGKQISGPPPIKQQYHYVKVNMPHEEFASSGGALKRRYHAYFIYPKYKKIEIYISVMWYEELTNLAIAVFF